MFTFKSLWKPWSGDSGKPPERDEHMMVTESLMLELEHHIREFERESREQDQEENRRKTGVDYSWLVSVPSKAYELPQMERLELEELCYQVKPGECGKVISAYRDSILNKPNISELPRLLKACIRQVLDQRPKEETLTEWVTKRTVSLASIKIRPHTKIAPFAADSDDIESQSSGSDCSRMGAASSTGVFTIDKSQSLPNYGKPHGIVHLPV